MSKIRYPRNLPEDSRDVSSNKDQQNGKLDINNNRILPDDIADLISDSEKLLSSTPLANKYYDEELDEQLIDFLGPKIELSSIKNKLTPHVNDKKADNTNSRVSNKVQLKTAPKRTRNDLNYIDID